MRYLVTGGRDYADRGALYAYLDSVHADTPITLLVIGLDPKKPKGADWLAYEWAESRGVDAVLFPPNWKGRGKPAGPYRNGLMARFLRITPGEAKGSAFPRADGSWGPGTLDMIRQAEAAGIPVRRIEPAELPARPLTTAQQEA